MVLDQVVRGDGFDAYNNEDEERRMTDLNFISTSPPAVWKQGNEGRDQQREVIQH